MKVIYKLIPYVIDDHGNQIPGSMSFIQRYQQFRPGSSNALLMDDWDAASQAMSEAEHIGLPVQLFFRFEMEADEIGSYPAFYFGLKITENVVRDNILGSKHLKKFDIVQDFSSEEIFVDEHARQVFEDCTRGVVFSPTTARSGRSWYRISSMPSLPEPVCILKTMFLEENDTPRGTYIVQSDGRDVLSDAACEFVRPSGPVSVRYRLPFGNST